jgi:hypothetical protein
MVSVCRRHGREDHGEESMSQPFHDEAEVRAILDRLGVRIADAIREEERKRDEARTRIVTVFGSLRAIAERVLRALERRAGR